MAQQEQWDKKEDFVDLFLSFEKVVQCISVILRQMYHMIQKHFSYIIYGHTTQKSKGSPRDFNNEQLKEDGCL